MRRSPITDPHSVLIIDAVRLNIHSSEISDQEEPRAEEQWERTVMETYQLSRENDVISRMPGARGDFIFIGKTCNEPAR